MSGAALPTMPRPGSAGALALQHVQAHGRTELRVLAAAIDKPADELDQMIGFVVRQGFIRRTPGPNGAIYFEVGDGKPVAAPPPPAPVPPPTIGRGYRQVDKAATWPTPPRAPSPPPRPPAPAPMVFNPSNTAHDGMPACSPAPAPAAPPARDEPAPAPKPAPALAPPPAREELRIPRFNKAATGAVSGRRDRADGLDDLTDLVREAANAAGVTVHPDEVRRLRGVNVGRELMAAAMPILEVKRFDFALFHGGRLALELDGVLFVLPTDKVRALVRYLDGHELERQA